MIFSEPLSQYEEILKDAIRTSMKESGAKLAKNFPDSAHRDTDFIYDSTQKDKLHTDGSLRQAR